MKKLGGFLCCILCLFLWLTMAEARGDGLLRLRGAALLLGPADTGFLVVTTESETFTVLPTTNQPQTLAYPIPTFPSISRDGKLVACIRLKSADPQRAAAAIYSIPEKKWTEYAEAEYIGTVAISPDGSKLAFTTAERQVPERFHVVDLVTGQQRLLPSPHSWAMSWSPDGTRLAYDFYQGEFGTRPAVGVVEVDTGKTWKIADGWRPSWSPSGEWIAYLDPAETSCIRVRPDGSEASTVTTMHRDFLGWPGKFILTPVWSPDSQKLLLNATRNVEGPSDILLFDFAKQKLKKAKRGGVAVLGWAEPK
jgi:Tol biopolymer transport system component